jgi:hypothetical protein
MVQPLSVVFLSPHAQGFNWANDVSVCRNMQVNELHPYMHAQTFAVAQAYPGAFPDGWSTNCGEFVYGRPLILTHFPGYNDGDEPEIIGNAMVDMRFGARFWDRLRLLIPAEHHNANLAFACPFRSLRTMPEGPAKQAARDVGLRMVDTMVATLHPPYIVVVSTMAFDDIIRRWQALPTPIVGVEHLHQTGPIPRTIVRSRTCTFDGQLRDVVIYGCTSVAGQAALNADVHIPAMSAYLNTVMPLL